MSVRSTIGPLTVAFIISAPVFLNALNPPTHRLINTVAAGDGSFDGYRDVFVRYLRESLGLGLDSQAAVTGSLLRVLRLLEEGGEREDDGSPFSPKARFYRHFHNPLLPWDAAGLLTRYPFHLQPHQYTSAVRWMQADNQSRDDGGAIGGNRAWRDARRLQYLVLTTADARQREAYAADLFRTLGQIMHLVVDASVPEHVRNDPHPLGAVSRNVLASRTAGNYEYWVSEQQARLGDAAFTARYLASPIGPAGVLGLPPPSGEGIATLPVARLIDTDRYEGARPDPNVTLGGPIGIAEFANANFFSEDTLGGVDLQDRRLPFPRRQDLVRRSDLAPLTSRIRAYLEKPAGQGLVTKFALAECRLQGRAAALPPYPCVDEAVWDETARHMLPRAIGYARAVLDYFFRGQIGVQTSLMRGGFPLIQITNFTEEEMVGVFEMIARPHALSPGEGRERSAVVNNGAVVTIGPRRSVTLPIAYLQADPTPFHMVVFRGRIGREEDAVAAQVFTVHHQLIVQTAHTADLSRACWMNAASGPFDEFKGESQSCSWRSIRQRTEGEILTNGASRVARVSVRGPVPGVELVLDGLPIQAGVWQRRGNEADPRSFSVSWPGPMGQPLPTLSVQLVDGTVTTTPIYAGLRASAEASKGYPVPSPCPCWVAARRVAEVTLTRAAAIGLTSYVPVSIAGHQHPTNIETDRFALPLLVEVLKVETLNGRVRYLQSWTDEATVYHTAPPQGSYSLLPDLKARFAALPDLQVPDVRIEALFERRYRSGELDFLRAFVSRELPPTTLTVVGRQDAAE